MAYFDNAATTYPKPESVYQFMDEFYRNNGANVGRGTHVRSKRAGELVAETRSLVQELLHCPTKQIVFVPTATIALNMIIGGIISLGAKTVYITPFEHNAVTRTLNHYIKDKNINVIELEVKDDLTFDMDAIRYQFDESNPDFVIMSHVCNTIGLITTVEDVFALAKNFHAYTLADMSQSAGLVDCNVGLDIFDFAVFAGHKTLYGPMGISGFAMKADIKLPAVIYGGTGYESENQDMPQGLPERFEVGTQNISGLAGLHAAIKWIKKTSIDSIREKELENRKKLMDLLQEYAFIDVVGVSDKAEYVGVVSCLIEGISSESVGGILDRLGIAVRTGLHCAPLAHKFLKTFPSGTVRFSVSYFTTDEEFQELRDAFDYIEENI